MTYNGHPLYTFVKDHKPGDVNGQGLACVRRRLVRGLSRRQPGLNPTRRARQRLIVAASGRTSRATRCEAPTGSGAGGGPRAANQVTPPTAKPAPPAAKPPPANNGIPQNNGRDGDADNNGGPGDGDGNV